MRILSYTLVFILFLLSACQHTPTKVTREEPVMGENLTAEKLLQGRPVILDARPAFEFNLAHIPGAVNVRWEDFSQPHPKFRGELQGDLFAIARRLALVGIDPDTKVVVVGKGAQGQGEEGRIAWTLKVLGVKEVYTLLHTSYRERNGLQEAPPAQNKSYWKPQVNEQLVVNLKDFKKQAGKKSTIILDVRSTQEFSLRNLQHRKGVAAQVIHLPWTDFFVESGLPSTQIEKKLTTWGISKETPILIVSNHGVRSGAVTYALNFLGFTKVRNFAGGYEQWN